MKALRKIFGALIMGTPFYVLFGIYAYQCGALEALKVFLFAFLLMGGTLTTTLLGLHHLEGD